MAPERVWSARAKALKHIFFHLLFIAGLYFASELLVWVLSLALTRINFQFFSSILGMIVIFSSTTLTGIFWKDFESLHHLWIKPKVRPFEEVEKGSV